MKHIKELTTVTHYFIVKNKVVVLLNNGKRHIVKLHSQQFSNFPLLFVFINNVRYQINDKTFCFKNGVI